MRDVFSVALVLVITNSFAQDDFLNSCLEKKKLEASSLKSFRAEMTQTVIMHQNGQSNQQKMKVQYLLGESYYSKTELNTPLGEMLVVCRQDTTYTRIGNSPWQKENNLCNENPVLKSYEMIKNNNLVFQSDSLRYRIYRDNDGSKYTFNTANCDLTSMEMNSSAKAGIATMEYKQFGDVRLPYRIIIDVPGQLTSTTEYNEVSINIGITPDFFVLPK